MGNTVKYNSHLFVVSPISSCDTFDFFTWKCKHRPYSIRKIHTLFPVLVHLSSVCNNVIVYVHYIPPPIHVYVSVCLSIYLSSVCMLVCTVSCQSVTLVSHTTCLSFVNVYVGTCPPICHIHVHHYMSVSRSVTPCPAHVFLSSFLYLYASTPAYPSHSYAQFPPYMFVCLCFCVHCPYIMFTAMCPCVCLPHSCILYIPFVHFDDCLSIYVSFCMSIFMQIYYMYSCLSVCLLHSCAILSIRVCESSCPFV